MSKKFSDCTLDELKADPYAPPGFWTQERFDDYKSRFDALTENPVVLKEVFGSIAIATKEMKQLKADLKKATELLRKCEFADNSAGEYRPHCPVCIKRIDSGIFDGTKDPLPHEKGCALAEFLKRMG